MPRPHQHDLYDRREAAIDRIIESEQLWNQRCARIRMGVPQWCADTAAHDRDYTRAAIARAVPETLSSWSQSHNRAVCAILPYQ